MASTTVLIFVALLAVATWVSPLVSLYLFVLASPFTAFNDLLGWDPRTRWAILLCLRGAWEAFRTGTSYVPRKACQLWAVFTVLAVGGLWIGNIPLVPDELEASRSALLAFVAGSCGMYGIWQLIRKRRQLNTLCAVFTASVLIASSIGIVQALIGYRLGEPTDRIAGTLDNANYFATYLALAATTLVLLVRLNLIKRWYGYIACAAAVMACGLTLSRTGTMAVLVGVGLALVVRSDRKLVSPRMIAAAAVGALLGSALLANYLLEYRRNVTNSDARLAEAGQAVEDLSRLEAFRYSLQLTAENPLAGVGFGTFPSRNYNANGFYVATHNTIMQVLVGTGLLGGALILSLIFSLVSPLHPQARRHLFPAAVAFGMCSLFGDYLESIEALVIFAVLYLSVRSLIAGPPATSNEQRPPCVV